MNSGVPVEKKIAAITKAMECHDGCPAADLALAKDYLIEMSYKINSLRPIQDCHSCRHWRITDCALAPGQMPPDHIIKSGCEKWEDAFEIPWS